MPLFTRSLAGLLFGAVLALPVSAAAQQTGATVFPLGCSFDPDVHRSLPRTAPLVTRNFAVPPKVSYRRFCPPVRNQAPYNTCVGWSTAYAAFSIVAAINPGVQWQSAEEIKVNPFSPSYVYNQIRAGEDCMAPVFVHQALDSLVRQGCARVEDFPFDCEAPVDARVRERAKPYAGLIEGFKILLPYPEQGITLAALTKKSLSEGSPVIAVVQCYESFMQLSPDGLWSGAEDRYLGHHALTVIGYDQDLHGGAFEVMNSWGENWGEKGFGWIRFSDFERVCAGAYELIKMVPQRPDPAPSAAAHGYDLPLAGKMRLVREGGEEIQARYAKQGHTYRTVQGYRSGTRFRLMVESTEPAFVYVIGSDATGEVFKLFPHKEGVSAALNYREAAIALPSETAFIKMDKTVGTDHLCVLFSKKPLKISELINSVKNDAQGGTFAEKVQRGLGNRFLGISQIRFDQGAMGFDAKGKPESAVMMVLEMEHLP
jgi:hypothetical protein